MAMAATPEFTRGSLDAPDTRGQSMVSCRAVAPSAVTVPALIQQLSAGQQASGEAALGEGKGGL